MSFVEGITLSAKRMNALDVVDRMSPGMRQCVHEFGLPIVEVCRKFGISNPAHIREIVREIWLGSRNGDQQRGAIDALDGLLIQSGSSLTADGLRRFLAMSNLAIVQVSPTKAMVEASMAEVSGFNVRCSRYEKHHRRLQAAIRVCLPIEAK